MEYKTSSHIYHRSNWTWRSLVYLASCLVSIFLSREPYFLPWNSFKINWSLAPDSTTLVTCSSELFLKESHEREKRIKEKLAICILILQELLRTREMLHVRLTSLWSVFWWKLWCYSVFWWFFTEANQGVGAKVLQQS